VSLITLVSPTCGMTTLIKVRFKFKLYDVKLILLSKFLTLELNSLSKIVGFIPLKSRYSSDFLDSSVLECFVSMPAIIASKFNWIDRFAFMILSFS